jgi:hypothetical protein
MERIDKLKYSSTDRPSTIEGRETNLYLTGPAEFLCSEIAKYIGAFPAWKTFFGEYVDPYKRMDYPVRALPALRIYNNTFQKDYESWFVEGDILLDAIFPASIRRTETQQLPDTITNALLQQFRSPEMFEAMCAVIPGLNELGKRFSADKSLAFEWGEELVPLTQMNLNFKIDLRAWDLYLESDNRTKEKPFERTLGDLEKLFTTIDGLRDDGTSDVEVKLEQSVKGDSSGTD